MITTLVCADGTSERRQLAAMRARAAEAGAEVQQTAAAILADVRSRGYEAVREHSLRLDGAEPREIAPAELDAALARIPSALRTALERSAANIQDYQSRLLPCSAEWTGPDGGVVGQLVRPLQRVGVYVPGGRAAYPSSVLMNAVPARVAGVEEIVMVTPPTAHLNDAVLAAARIAGVDRVFALGGVQAVAALTWGAGPVPRVDKLVGPGTAYVAAAKRLAYGTLDIDMVAGPSEVLVIADETANAVWVAADLLSQAEHDPMASAVLLTTSMALAEAVMAELECQTARLSNADTIRRSLADYGALMVCGTLEQCAALADEIAPEHLEVVTAEPRALLPRLHNAGAIFLGANSPEPLGDYLAGPDHVLPTSGTARFFSPLSVESFLKRTSLVDFSREALAACRADIVALALSEGLTAHANSIQVRFPDDE